MTTILTGIYITYKVFSQKLVIHKNYCNIGLLGLFVWSLISGIINASFMSIAAAFALFMYFCISVYLQHHCDNENKTEKLFNCLLNFSIFSAVLGLIEKLLAALFNINIGIDPLNMTLSPAADHRIYSTFGNPNVAGNWFAIMILISIYFYNTAPENKKSFYGASTLLFAVSLTLTGSRGAFMGLLLGLLFYYSLKNNRKDKWLFVSVFILIAAFTFLPSDALKHITGHDIDGSFNGRFDIWYGSLKMIKLKPIAGWGISGVMEHGGQFVQSYAKRPLYHSHNIWITFMATLGIIGSAIYLYIKVNMFRNLKTLYKGNVRLAPLLAGIQALIVAHGLVDFTIIAPQTGLLFIGCSSIILSLANEQRNNSINKNLFDYKLKSITKVG